MHENHRGDVVGVTDIGGNVVYRFEYSTYGEIFEVNSSNELDEFTDFEEIVYGFQGRGLDSETDGLMYFRNRYYNPKLGRFLSRDPLQYVDSYGLYEAFGGNPYSYQDPIGKNYSYIVIPIKQANIKFKDGSLEFFMNNTWGELDVEDFLGKIENQYGPLNGPYGTDNYFYKEFSYLALLKKLQSKYDELAKKWEGWENGREGCFDPNFSDEFKHFLMISSLLDYHKFMKKITDTEDKDWDITIKVTSGRGEGSYSYKDKEMHLFGSVAPRAEKSTNLLFHELAHHAAGITNKRTSSGNYDISDEELLKFSVGIYKTIEGESLTELITAAYMVVDLGIPFWNRGIAYVKDSFYIRPGDERSKLLKKGKELLKTRYPYVKFYK